MGNINSPHCQYCGKPLLKNQDSFCDMLCRDQWDRETAGSYMSDIVSNASHDIDRMAAENGECILCSKTVPHDHPHMRWDETWGLVDDGPPNDS